MAARTTRFSPSPSRSGTRSAGGAVEGGGRRRRARFGLPRGLARAQVELGTATGDVTMGSNYSNAVPQQALAAAVEALPNENVNVTINEVDHNTFQENITTYLQNPD
jgi:multiple sugar transport system substrate-binding protein